MKSFDINYKLLDEMYRDEYYPNFLCLHVSMEYIFYAVILAVCSMICNAPIFLTLIIYPSR